MAKITITTKGQAILINHPGVMVEGTKKYLDVSIEPEKVWENLDVVLQFTEKGGGIFKYELGKNRIIESLEIPAGEYEVCMLGYDGNVKQITTNNSPIFKIEKQPGPCAEEENRPVISNPPQRITWNDREVWK